MASSSTCGTQSARATSAARAVLPDPEHPTTAIRSMSALLLGGPDQDLVDRHAPRLRDRVADALRDVLRQHDLRAGELLGHTLEDLRPVVEGQFGGRRSRLYEGDPHVAGRHLLAQRFAEGANAVLGGVVHA